MEENGREELRQTSSKKKTHMGGWIDSRKKKITNLNQKEKTKIPIESLFLLCSEDF